MDYAGDKYKHLSSFSFSYRFEYDEDIVFFSHFVPYTNVDLKQFLATLQANDKHKDTLCIDGLCRSLGGNTCYLLTITNNLKDALHGEEEIEKF